MTDVVCVGSAAVDVVYKVKEFPSPDEICLAEWSKTFCGGSSANVAVALSRLGVKSGLAGKVGEDEEGEWLLKRMREEGVDTREVMRTGRTARSTILIREGGEKTIITDTGGVLKDASDVEKEYVRKAEIVYVGDCFLPVAEKAIETARGIKVVRIKNVHLYPGFDVETIVSEADFVIMNERTYSHYKGGDEKVIVTLGEKGCLYVGEEVVIPGVRVKSVDTTGAGDAFCAGFISQVLKKKSVEEALRFANAAGGLSTTRYGAMDSMPSQKEVESILSSIDLSEREREEICDSSY